MAPKSAQLKLRSQAWWDNPANPDMTALYLERFLNYGLTREELQAGRPIIGIAQTGSDLVPCNRHHIVLAERVRAGIRDAGGIPFEFPVHPLQETGKRPTASLDRNLAYLGLVEVLYGYPLDGVVLTTGCDKTTPACVMAAATVNLPAIVLSGGPMLNGYYDGKRAGSGLVIWKSRRLLASGQIDYAGFMDRVAASAPSVGHCNTMGTALSMNCLAEALGMSLPGCGAIPAPYRERAQMAYETGRRAVTLVQEDLTPRKILTKRAFENAIVVASAIAASSNAPVHINAMARHAGVELTNDDWQRVGGDVPVLANVQPSGGFLGEDFFRAGGVPAVMNVLLAARKLHGDVLTVSGRTVAENVEKTPPSDMTVIHSYEKPLLRHGGFLVMSGNLFDSAVLKTSVIGPEFRERYLMNPNDPNAFVGRAIVFDGPEDYHSRIEDPSLDIDADCILVIRYTGTIGYPGSAEVVNMQPPAALIKRGIITLPTLGDGRQSGTADAPSILNASPEAAAGGNLAILRTGDRIRVDLNKARVDVLIPEQELAARRRSLSLPKLENQTPWQEIYRSTVGQLDTGGCMELALKYQDIAHTKGLPAIRIEENAMPKGKILILDYDFGELEIERAIIEGAGFEFASAQCKSEDDVIELGRDADGVLNQYAPVGQRAIDAFTRCRVIARYGTGVDIVDVDAATRHGIQVTNAPNEWCADEVADHAVTLWLAAARKICEYDRATRDGEWQWQTGQPIWRLRGRVFGLLAFGAIARSIAEKVRPFGVDIWAHDPFLDPAEIRPHGVRPVSFDELIEGSDYLVISNT